MLRLFASLALLGLVGCSNPAEPETIRQSCVKQNMPLVDVTTGDSIVVEMTICGPIEVAS